MNTSSGRWLFHTILALGLAFAGGGCSREIEVPSYVSIHKQVGYSVGGVDRCAPVENTQRPNTGGDVCRDYVEHSSVFNAGGPGARLSPTIQGLLLLVEFPAAPVPGQSVHYVESRGPASDMIFMVYNQNSGERVVLQSKTATLTGISEVVADAEVLPAIPPNDKIMEKRAFSYTIQWNDAQLDGKIYIVKSSHFEKNLAD